MLGNKEFVGFAIQDDIIRVAHLKVSGKSLKLVKLDRFSLIEKLESGSKALEMQSEEAGVFEEGDETDAIFGFEDNDGDGEDELDFDSLEDFTENDNGDGLSLDMVDEADEPQSNELLAYNILSGIDTDKVNLGLNIPAGNTIFQVIRDTDFNEVKKKNLVQDLEDKLESIYGVPKSTDNYSYEVREDGSLLLASIDHESATLQLINTARELYSGKMMIHDVVPDEMLLVGLAKANYDLQPDEITAIIQFGKESCRVVFMKGNEVWLTSPIINEGTEKRSFLNTVFSKILFQLDTGEVPNLDRILLANNTIGNSAVDFFKDNFPDIFVEDLSFQPDFFDTENIDSSSISRFTTAIGAALAASDAAKKDFPQLSFVPAYVSDRQKIFKLQWHGIFILFLIFLTPITFNYFYTQNARQIDSLSSELNTMNSKIEQITPIVQNANELSGDLSILKEKLTLLDTLSQGSKEWTVKLQMINEGIAGISNSWITSFTQGDGGTFLQGYTLYRNRIPRIVNIFDEATLLNVTNEMMREKQIFSFSILVEEFAASDSVYSQPAPEEVKQLIGK